MQDRKAKLKPFENSLTALAQVAMHEAGAEGYAFFRRETTGGPLVCERAAGSPITEQAAAGAEANSATIAYPLEPNGVVVFSFPDKAGLRTGHPRLDQIAGAIEAVWAAARASRQYSELASQVADLEVRLLDSKIADRVSGLLSRPGEASALEAIARHVDEVLKPAPGRRVLEQLSQELEEAMEARRLTNRAKAILRAVHGMSEEQAHTHLRQSSRRLRKRLKDVALDVIAQHPVGQGGVQSV